MSKLYKVIFRENEIAEKSTMDKYQDNGWTIENVKLNTWNYDPDERCPIPTSIESLTNDTIVFFTMSRVFSYTEEYCLAMIATDDLFFTKIENPSEKMIQLQKMIHKL